MGSCSWGPRPCAHGVRWEGETEPTVSMSLFELVRPVSAFSWHSISAVPALEAPMYGIPFCPFSLSCVFAHAGPEAASALPPCLSTAGPSLTAQQHGSRSGKPSRLPLLGRAGPASRAPRGHPVTLSPKAHSLVKELMVPWRQGWHLLFTAEAPVLVQCPEMRVLSKCVFNWTKWSKRRRNQQEQGPPHETPPGCTGTEAKRRAQTEASTEMPFRCHFEYI